MFKYHNLNERFGNRIFFDDDQGQGGQGGTGQIDYGTLFEDPKALEAFQNSDFFKKAIQSEADKVRTKATTEKKTLEERLTAQEKINSELLAFKNETVKVKVLKEMGIPLEFWDIIQAGTEEEIKGTAEKLLTAHRTLLTAEVETRLKANGSNPGAGHQDGTLTKEQFSKLTYAERTKLYNEDRELYDSLNK